MDTIILCGGRGVRLQEETEFRPKPMVEIGGKPMLWHIMEIYSHYGYNRFILALGYKGEHIKKYFYDYRIVSSDFTLVMNPHKPPKIHSVPDECDWEITFVDTGLDTLKGGRIKRLEKYIKSDNFHLTYGDCVANVDIKELYKFHISHNSIGTLTAVRPPSRFGELMLSGDKVIKFEEKPQLGTGAINGGFFVFKKEFMQYLTPDVNCDLEFGALQKLARDGELRAYSHEGFWQCMDNVRDRDYLNKLWQEGQAFWKLW
ncbi:MAG TPA: glucose-1-phosphate cytidylyltransferase [Dehalococcoidia bacterium]|nr:glucose-1-phosphate cytidylyltransferase [Dehalococcoidia bacterium]